MANAKKRKQIESSDDDRSPRPVKERRSKEKYDKRRITSGKVVINDDDDDDFVNPPKTQQVRTEKIQKNKGKAEAKVDRNVRFQPYGEDRLNPRLSPASFYDTMRVLDEVHKRVIDNIGFGSLHKLNIKKIPPSLGYWLVSNYDSQRNRLNLGRVVFKLTKEKVGAVLGIPVGGTKIVEKNPRSGNQFVNRWKKQFGKSVKKIYIKHVLDNMKASRKPDDLFMLNFIVAYCTAFGKVTQSTTVNQRVLPIIKGPNDIQRLDWGSYMIDNLK